MPVQNAFTTDEDYGDFLRKIGMPEQGIAALYNAYRRLAASETSDRIFDKYFDGGDITPDVQSLAAETGIEPRELWLAICVMLAGGSKTLYAERGIGDDIFYDSMSDIAIWAKVCKRDFGCWGLHEKLGWLSNTLKLSLFRLGRFQYERVHFHGEHDYTKDGRTVKVGDPVINIHIPEGGPLLPELRFESYKKAVKFWGLDVLTCDTWLFYPAHREFLQEGSHIVEFMDDFDIIEWDESESLGNMWRIFDRRDSYDPASLPRDTGMRRAYADWLAKTGKTGSGYGIRIEKQ